VSKRAEARRGQAAERAKNGREAEFRRERLKREQRSEIRRGQVVECIRKEGTR
jgi:hypothetical protein